MKLPKLLAEKRLTLRKKNWWIIVSAVLLVGAGTTWYFLLGPGKQITAAAQSEPTYQTATVRRGDIRISITGSATLAAHTAVDLGFSTAGTVTELNVELGDHVTTGEELASLGNSVTLEANLANAELAYLQAQQALKQLQDNADVSLAQAYQDWVTAKEAYDEAVTAEARTAYARCSQEVLTKYSAELDRVKERLSSLAVGSDEWIDASNDYATAQANYDYCRSYTEDEKTVATADLQVAENAMKLAERTYNTLKDSSGIDPDELTLAEAKVKQTKDQLAQAQEDLEGITLVAPIDGIVTYLAAGKNSYVDTTTYITISDVSDLEAEINVDESDLDKFALNSPAEIVFDALPDQTFTGTVVEVEPQLANTNMVTTAQGIVQLDSDGIQALQSMPLGLSGTAEIIKSEAKEVLWVPIEAVRDLGDGQYGVFVLESDGKLRFHSVQVGLMDETRAEITQGLSEGEVVSTGVVETAY